MDSCKERLQQAEKDIAELIEAITSMRWGSSLDHALVVVADIEGRRTAERVLDEVDC